VDMELMEFMIPNSDLGKIFGPDLSREESEKVLSHGGCHYFLGGVKVDEDLRSSLDGLYAAGEVAGGLFGASRLWGSALADAIVFGARAGSRAAEWVITVGNDVYDPERGQVEEERVRLGDLCVESKAGAASFEGEISEVMWRMCGVLKNSDTMSAANYELERLEDEASKIGARKMSDLGEVIEVMNMFDVARVVVKAASLRRESRGAFWRLDYKEPSNEDWLASLVVSRRNGALVVEAVPPIMTKLRVPRDWVPRIGNHVSGHLQV
jgi:fumarate reductase (CoM/CoB) subunit A